MASHRVPEPSVLARCLGVSAERLARSCDEAGVDVEFLARAAREGDPYGAFQTLAPKIERSRLDVFLAVSEAADVTPGELAQAADRMGLDAGTLVRRLQGGGGPSPVPVAEAPSVAALAAERAARALRDAHRNLVAALVVLGLTLTGLALATFAWPALAAAVLLQALAVSLLLLGAGTLLVGLRFAAVGGPTPGAVSEAVKALPAEAKAPPAAAVSRSTVEEAWRSYRASRQEGPRSLESR